MSEKKQDGDLDYEKTDVLHDDMPVELAPAIIANEIAHVENHKFSPWTKSMFHLYAVLFVAYCCGCLNGYDGMLSLEDRTSTWLTVIKGSLMGGLNGMTSYQRTFNM
jgi:hypothetical protein